MKIKILVSPDGKRSIVTSCKQSSSPTPNPVTYQNEDNDSHYNESIASQSNLSEYEEAEEGKYAALYETYLSKAAKSYTDNADRDVEMTDAPEEIIDDIQISQPASAPVADIGEKPNPDTPIPSIEALSTPSPPQSAITTKNPEPSPVVRYDATYAFYVDGVYEFWSMGLKRAQVAGFIKFLANKTLEEQKVHILELMKAITKRRSWERLVRKDGEAARRARDSAVLSSMCLTTMA